MNRVDYCNGLLACAQLDGQVTTHFKCGCTRGDKNTKVRPRPDAKSSRGIALVERPWPYYIQNAKSIHHISGYILIISTRMALKVNAKLNKFTSLQTIETLHDRRAIREILNNLKVYLILMLIRNIRKSLTDVLMVLVNYKSIAYAKLNISSFKNRLSFMYFAM